MKVNLFFYNIRSALFAALMAVASLFASVAWGEEVKEEVPTFQSKPIAYNYIDLLKSKDPIGNAYIVYSVSSNQILVNRYGSKKKYIENDPFRWETFSTDYSYRLGYFGRGPITIAKKHIFLPKNLTLGSSESESASGQGTANLYGTFSTEIIKVEEDTIHVKHRFPHQDFGRWDRDMVLKKMPEGYFLVIRDELKVYNPSGVFAHTVWELKQ